MRFSRGRAVAAGLALAVALGIALLLFLDGDGVPRRDAEHDSVTAWLTCHSLLRDSVPGAIPAEAPWSAAREHVRKVDDATYWAAGTAAIQDEEGRAAEFECLLEWTRGGWRLHSLHAVVVPVAP